MQTGQTARLRKAGAAAMRRLFGAYRKAGLSAARVVLSHEPFSIVSNNCWGAHIYRELRVPYASPFVGLFIPPPCYIQLAKEFDHLIDSSLSFVQISRYQNLNDFRASRNLDYPIALLAGQVEIHFMHYKSREECTSKWHRRVERMVRPAGGCFFKFCDHDGATSDELQAFDSLPLLRKVCFVGNSEVSLSCSVVIPSCSGGRVPDGGELAMISPRYFNSLRWIAGHPLRSAMIPPYLV